MNELEFALDDCLQQLAAGTASIDQCLALYPQLAAELRPLLETALRLQQGKHVRPSGALRDRTRARLADHIQEHPRRHPKRRRPIPGLVTGLVALALTLLVVSTAFAQAALPGEGLYTWKLSTEQVWRATSNDPLAVDLSLAGRRTDELVSIGKDPVRESDGIAAYTDVLNRLAVESAGPHSDEVLGELQAHQQTLAKAGLHVPALDRIIEHSKSAHGSSKP
jgi:hypothetical protein